ncbi:hypothetical protein [Marinobacter sp. CHS3-4]|uniref:hypothetical protein n=1 Tax=Marinobacter sp. CHS3-4 TaxID=3045174 RepID=UPI0024B4DB04|nr:hypothetical protein [Marinobacter sp. CHS3-4]MDI9244669.1 hypothetical protein [Marinobacter sp. CHS3-4]
MKNFVRQFSVKQIVLSDVFLSTPLALALVIAADPIAQLAGGPSATFYMVVGIVMLLWCVDMTVMAMNEPLMRKFFNLMIAVDVMWSLASLGLMLWFAESLQALGWALFALNILVPLDMAWMKRTAGGANFKPQLS